MNVIEPIRKDERSDSLIKDAAEMARDVQEDSRLVGYVVLAMYSDGSGRTAGWKPQPKGHGIGAQLWSAWARSALEHHFMYGEGIDATYSVLNGEN